MSLKDKIRSAKDIQSESVYVSEWDVTFEVRSMTAAERAIFVRASVDDEGEMDFTSMYVGIVAATAYDPETGTKVFEEGEKDLELLASKAGSAVEKLAIAGLRLSGMSKEAINKETKN